MKARYEGHVSLILKVEWCMKATEGLVTQRNCVSSFNRSARSLTLISKRKESCKKSFPLTLLNVLSIERLNTKTGGISTSSLAGVSARSGPAGVHHSLLPQYVWEELHHLLHPRSGPFLFFPPPNTGKPLQTVS